MSESVLQTKQLTKVYHSVYALSNVSIQLRPGKIYGLIGKNGAGKTTLMRLAAGLNFPSSGDIELFGYTGVNDLCNGRRKSGFMIEAPSINLSMTAKENLYLHGLIKGVSNRKAEDELLTLVGLSDTKRKKARHFSLGMKQRLGIALALVGDPELLVLDEPINGLDPIGVVEIRELLIKLCMERNLTILLSSHNLPELYQVATDYIIIDQGEVKKEITLHELEELCKRYLLIRTPQVKQLTDLLEKDLQTSNYTVMPDNSIRLHEHIERVDEIARILHQNNILVTNLSIEGDTLENYFVSVIGGSVSA